MAQREQLVYAETYLSLKKALKRKAYDSDSDSSIEKTTNRGNKLKKRARYLREGQLASAYGSSYRETIQHAGFRRDIISRNPPLIDDDGYEVETDDDEDRVQEAVAAAAAANPYAAIRLENILAPLTAVTELPNHPTLSRPFTSKALSELADQGSNWMHKENEALWKVRPMLTRLVGDRTWAACEVMVTANDEELFEEDFMVRYYNRTTNGSTNGENHSTTTPHTNGEVGDGPREASTNGAANKNGERNKSKDHSTPDDDVSMIDVNAVDEEPVQKLPVAQSENPGGDKSTKAKEREPGLLSGGDSSTVLEETGASGTIEAKTNGVSKKQNEEAPTKSPAEPKKGAGDETGSTPDKPKDGSEIVAKPVQAVGAAQVNGSRALSHTPDVFEDQPLHPLFLAPRSAHPERDLGLPENEAEDIRRLLQLWVQKQEEVARGTKRLYEGLLQADRRRQTVFNWAKAEAHCGPNRDMSDGEDWYDREAWGLTEDLKKGHDEEEEDAQQTQKKTRNRR